MDVNRLRSVATAVIGFFGFLLALLSVASALGGGLQGLGLSILVGGIVASGVYFLYPYFTGNSRKLAKVVVKEKPIAKPSMTSKPVTYEAVCDPGPYDVDAGNPAKVPLNVQQGDRVVGDVAEDENYKFNCYIADSANYVIFVNKQRGFKSLFKGEGYGAYHLDLVIPYNAQWYAVLDAYGQQYTREVWVNLKRPKR